MRSSGLEWVLPNLSVAGPCLGLPVPGPVLVSLKVLGSYGPGGRKYSSCSVGGFAVSSFFCNSNLTLNHVLLIQESFKFSNFLVCFPLRYDSIFC